MIPHASCRPSNTVSRAGLRSWPASLTCRGPALRTTYRPSEWRVTRVGNNRMPRADQATMAASDAVGECAMPKLKFDHCVIHVSDWERSNAFYRDVMGAEVVRRGKGWVYRFADMQLNCHGPDLDPA